MARGGSSKGDKHFEDSRMNPGTKKGGHAKEPNAEEMKKQGDAIARNVTGKSGTSKEGK